MKKRSPYSKRPKQLRQELTRALQSGRSKKAPDRSSSTADPEINTKDSK